MVGLTFCYLLVVLFYLLAFAKTVLRLEGKVLGQEPLKLIRYVLAAIE